MLAVARGGAGGGFGGGAAAATDARADGAGRSAATSGEVTASGALARIRPFLPASNLYQSVIGLHIQTWGASSGRPSLPVRANRRVEAAGIVTAIDLNTEVPCTGVTTSANRSCAGRTHFTDLAA